MSRLRQFIEWEWIGEWERGKSIEILGDKYGKSMIVGRTCFLCFDSYPIILPINVPGWIQMRINSTAIFGEMDWDWNGIPTEFLHELRGDREENKYFGTPVHVLPNQRCEWIFKFGGEIIEEACETEEKKFRVLFADEERYDIKGAIENVGDIKRIKILIPYMRYDGIDAVKSLRLLGITDENLDGESGGDMSLEAIDSFVGGW